MARDGETGRFQALSKLFGVRSKRVDKICRLLKHVEDLDGRSGNSWRDRVREEVGSALVSQDVDNLLRRSSVPTGAAAESLAKRGTNHINLTFEAEELWRTTTLAAKDTSCVALINEGEGSISLGELVDLIEGSDITIHGKNSISDDHSQATVLRILKHLLENLHIHVLVAESARLAESDTINDGGMIELIRNDRIFCRQTSFEKPGIRVESGRVQDRIVEFVERSDFTFELLMDVLRTADEPHRAHSEAVRVKGILRRLDNSWVIRESQVIIGAKVEDSLAVGIDFHILRGGNHALSLVSARITHAV